MPSFTTSSTRLFTQLAMCMLLLLSRATGFAQESVRISPASVYLHDGRQSLQVTFTSASTQTAALHLSVIYGFDGMTPAATDTPESSRQAKSCAAWVRCQPSALELERGQSATVEITAAPPAGLKDGEYWGRVIVRNGEGGSTVERPVVAEIPLAYRKGDTYADVQLAGTKIIRDGETVRLNFELQQLGNSAYHGNLALVVRNAKGKELFKEKMPISVYETGSKRFDIPGKTMPPGVYKATLNFDAERPDLGDAALLVLPKNYTVEFRLP
ncbi:MAG: hypothetical protein M5R41_12205 [Bacteroidia bacterium]|nr:hypothetical protein [Bacteroidia bacterium]